MKIKVLFFAQLREALGEQERVVQAPEKSTVKKLVCQLLEQAGLRSLESLPLLYAVNEQLVSGDEELSDEDTLALMPPVAGG